MKHIIRKRFLAWNFDKEEAWLNEMSAKGLQLTDVHFCKFIFEDGIPGEYIYRMELLDRFLGTAESERYISFIEDTGAEHIGCVMRWAFFRKKSDKGRFDLFSDIDSRTKHLKRLQILLFVVGVCVLLMGIINLSAALNGGLGGNLYFGVIDPILGLLLLYGYVNISFKKRSMKKERALHE